MTKSQNTKKEQNCIKQNEKSFIQKDLSLTELWQKGELPNGWYWVEGRREEGIYAYTAEYLNNMYRPRNSEKIIEKVPSYDEWQASEKYNKHLEEVIKVYERKDKQATETSIAYNELAEENDKLKTENKWYSEQLNESVKEIAQLKELLKDARNVLKMVDTYYGDYDSTKGFLIVERIDEVLK